MTWRIYYEDGTTFSDADGAPHDSPPWGIVAIAQPTARKTFRACLYNGPYFLFRTDWKCWLECDRDGLLDQLTHHTHLISCFRSGRYIRSDVFKRIWKTALEYANAS
jgi:hypothetical protein